MLLQKELSPLGVYIFFLDLQSYSLSFDTFLIKLYKNTVFKSTKLKNHNKEIFWMLVNIWKVLRIWMIWSMKLFFLFICYNYEILNSFYPLAQYNKFHRKCFINFQFFSIRFTFRLVARLFECWNLTIFMLPIAWSMIATVRWLLFPLSFFDV